MNPGCSFVCEAKWGRGYPLGMLTLYFDPMTSRKISSVGEWVPGRPLDLPMIVINIE